MNTDQRHQRNRYPESWGWPKREAETRRPVTQRSGTLVTEQQPVSSDDANAMLEEMIERDNEEE